MGFSGTKGDLDSLKTVQVRVRLFYFLIHSVRQENMEMWIDEATHREGY